jgi:hypothetical protein
LTTVKQGTGGSRAVLTIALALVAFALLPQLVRPWIRMRADSWFHAAVVAVIQRDGVPPEDPYFAGLRLQYMWFFHWVLAGLDRLLPLGPFWWMVVVNGATLFALCFAAARLGRRFAGSIEAGAPSTRVAGLTPLVMTLGLGALTWLFMPVRALLALVGRTGGLEHLAHEFRLSPLDIPTTRAFLSDFNSCPFFLNKFLVGNAYGLALLALVLYLDGLVDFFGRPRPRPLVVAGAALLAMLLLHPVVGFTAVAVSGMAGLALFGMGPGRGGLHIRQAMQWGGVAAAAFAVATPYLRSVTSGKPVDQFLPFHFDLVNLLGLVAGNFLVILAALGPLRRAWGGGTLPGRFYVFWCALTFLISIVIRLPGPNTTDKFTYLIHVPLAIPAAIGLAEWARGRARLAWLLLLLLPANLVGWAGYWGDPDRSDRPADVRAAYAWLAGSTPADAVMIDNRERCDMVVTVPRAQFWGREAYAEQWGYSDWEMERRRGLRDLLYDPARPVTAADLKLLERLKRPVYVLWRRDDFTSAAEFTKLDAVPDLFERAFDSPTVRIYRVRSAP